MYEQPDPYAVLGISPDSEDVVIRAAYRALKEKYSGGRGARDAWDKQRAREIDAAYAVLRDPASRRAHDRRRQGGERDGPFAVAEVMPSTVRSSPLRPEAPSTAWVRPPDRFKAWAPAMAVTVVVGLALVGSLAMRRHHIPSRPQVARGLTIRKRYAVSSIRLAAPLPCYVNGRPIGQLLLRDCAIRNGVATGPLDVGLNAPAPPPSPGSPSPVTPSPRFALARPAVATAPSLEGSLPPSPNRVAARPQSVGGAPAPAVSPTPRHAESIASVQS
ncbi:MAG: J domain-containing protein, partial [Caulobacteraceae bacterium]